MTPKGGRRPGAGKPATGKVRTVPVLIMATDAEKIEAQEKARVSGFSLGAWTRSLWRGGESKVKTVKKSAPPVMVDDIVKLED